MARSTGTKSCVKKLGAGIALALAASLTGCGSIPQSRPHDPPPGRALFEQAPKPRNWAVTRCCGHLTECQAHQTRSC